MIDNLDPTLREGMFRDYDGLVEQLRMWFEERRISHVKLDELAGLAQGHAGKILGEAQIKKFSTFSLFAVSQTLGLRFRLEEDPELVAQMRQHWEQCEVAQKRTLRKAQLGKATKARVFPVIAREMQKRSNNMRNHQLSPEQRTDIARKAGKASGRARLRKGLMEAAVKASKYHADV